MPVCHCSRAGETGANAALVERRVTAHVEAAV